MILVLQDGRKTVQAHETNILDVTCSSNLMKAILGVMQFWWNPSGFVWFENLGKQVPFFIAGKFGKHWIIGHGYGT